MPSRGGFSSKISKAVLSVARNLGQAALLSSKESWNLGKIHIPPNTLCRGITESELNKFAMTGQIPTFTGASDAQIGDCDYAKQVLSGQGGLLSLSPDIGTARLYGANRSFIPNSGAILILGLPAFYVPISEHVRMCPQLCDSYTKQFSEVSKSPFVGSDASSTAQSDVDIVGLCVGAQEVTAVVGRHNGVDFSDMLNDDFVHSVIQVMGSGRGMLVDCATCVTKVHENKDYAPRALSIEITLATDPEHLKTLTEQMVRSGHIEPGQRIITADDAAIIKSDPDLFNYLTSKAGPNGPVTVTSLPEGIYGEDIVEHLKTHLQAANTSSPTPPSDESDAESFTP